MRMSLGLFGICIVVLPAAAASAGVISQGALWDTAGGGNGHFYEIVMPTSPADSFTWTQARVAAANMTHLGSTGHLVTVGSAAESDFLHQQFGSYIKDITPNTQTGRAYAWIGLFAPTSTSNFEWVTGEPVNYTDWAPSEPNFFGTEFWQYVHYWNRDFGSGPTWTWNNEKNDGYNPPFNSYGFIAEFDGPFTATPEPASFVLVLTGFGSIGFAAWKRRRA